MNPTFFAKRLHFRKWLEKNYNKKQELWVGYYKVSSKKSSITWPESVEEALCFGWIDGIRKSIDEISYMIRFTPRRENSIWSEVNIKNVEKLIKQGLMQPAGFAIYNKRKDKNSGIYSFEQKVIIALSKEYEKKFKLNKKAWAFFQAQVPSYKKTAIHWVMSAKQEVTQLKRLNELIKDSAVSLKIKQLRR